MSTTYHDAIATGAPANASTFNTPLGDLDAAIAGLDSTLDAIIIGSGTSPAEVIAARSGYTVLDDRIDDLYLESKVLLVDAGFVGNTSNKRFTSFSAAHAAASDGDTIFLAPGTYSAGFTLTKNNLTIIGSGMPAYDEATGRLVGGTIIAGRIVTGQVSGLTIRDLGVDLSDYSDQVWDCIGSTNGNFRADRTFINLALRGNGDMVTNRSHGLYLVGNGNQVVNVRVYRCYHGIAIHGQRTSMNNIYVYACYGTSVVIKGKNGFDVYDVNISNLQIEGAPALSFGRAGALQIQNADNTNTYDVNINNVTVDNAVLGGFEVFLGENDGSIHDIQVSNMISRRAQNQASLGDFRIKQVTNLTLHNCQSLNRTSGYGFQIDDTPTIAQVRLSNCYADGSASRQADMLKWAVYEMNGTYWRQSGGAIFPVVASQSASGFLQSAATGAGSNALLSVTAANTPVATLSNGSLGVSEYSGLVLVFARNGTATANNSASYLLLVHKHYNNSNNACVQIALGGQTAGSAGASPSFTWTLDGTNNQLKASPVASTSSTFYFVFTCIGNIKAVAL